MMSRQALPFFALVMLWSTGWSCNAPTRPAANDQYSTILLGEVVGVRLTDYAAARQREIRDGTQRYSDGSHGYEIDVLPIELLKGAQGIAVGKVVTLQVPWGCSLPRADLQQYGLFFLNQKSMTMPMYQDDLDYKKRLVSLGSRNLLPCMTRMEHLTPHPCWKPRISTLECLETVKDFTNKSCPSSVQELREKMHQSVFWHFDSELPRPDPSKGQ